ncbi:hypothetical protein FQN60_018710 [Etheostoma spectabile]|uniref:DRBM domain-containing protein n=1 Tax=Etheostoma spectabile TaxID=54343 RepID=A0A5J5CEK4_9PERO|nr:hypothetical protein FQN60_018710 [Etheostoma spectabile]
MSFTWCGLLETFAGDQKCTVEYHTLTPVGTQHDHTFTVRVEVTRIDQAERQAEATGIGKTEDEAKDQAAKACMLKSVPPALLGMFESQQNRDTPTSDSETRSRVEPGSGNTVARLQELCQEKSWPAPWYTYLYAQLTHICCGRVIVLTHDGEIHICLRGCGTSKKAARRAAAERILQQTLLITRLTDSESVD